MQTVKRLCITDYTITDKDGTSFTVQQAKEYTTSPERDDGTVMVFSRYWVRVPVEIFEGEREFTPLGFASPR